MLGTNDAKDKGDHGPDDWVTRASLLSFSTARALKRSCCQHHNCGGPDAPTLSGCTFAEDYAAMIKLVRTLGTSAKGPKIYVRPGRLCLLLSHEPESLSGKPER